ncbi:sugar transporter [Celerinatantimonas sp. MCCC 1A17872]|uniref:sugar transporter n=1 Tax=Celerinatantimonas sp. MCCC 1A17872 TaxID=3177514 RepID=UPI0038BE2E90
MSRSGFAAWVPVTTLAIAAFIFNTSEFVPVGLLTDIGHTFSMSAAQVGIMLTIYAWCVALLSVPCLLLTGHMERRKLLMGLFALFVVSHILSTFAWNFQILMVSRLGVAIAHSVFWAITPSLAVRIAPKGGETKAVSMVALGVSIAMILGLPLGRLIDETFNWRASFAAIGFAALLVAILLYRILPVIESKNAGSVASIPVLFRRPALVSVYILALLVVTAHYSAYSYIEPFIEQIARLSSQFATSILFVFGIAGIAASFMFSYLNKRYPGLLLNGVVAMLAVVMACLLPVSRSEGTMSLLALVWGIAITLFFLSLQLRVLALADDATDVAMAFFSGIVNLGIGSGALLGSQVSLQLGMAHIGEVGALVAAAGFVMCGFCCWRFGLTSSLVHKQSNC